MKPMRKHRNDLTWAAALAVMFMAAPFSAHDTHAPLIHPKASDTYTITATLELAKPFNAADMTDPFQEARVISQTADSCVVEITYYPLFRQEVGENRNWRKDYAGMTEYLRPTPTENWDEKMRTDLLAELRSDGIDPEQLTDKQLVELVSRWAMRRSTATSAFAIWTLHYPGGKPEVLPALRQAFERERSKAGKTEQQMFEQEALGRSMYYDKVRGSCTSSSVYLATIFRALGIPTRIVFCIPPFDANDPKQAEMFYSAIRHNEVRETVRTALGGVRGFANHLFNEVYVGGRWVRLNYATLGQPVLDSRYFGLLTHILTTSDLSEVRLAETWGTRYFRYDESQPRLSSVNPYRLLAVSDSFGENARVPNPDVTAAELQTVTIDGLIRPGDKRIPTSLARQWLARIQQAKSETSFLISIKERVPGARPMRAFEQRASHDFLLAAPGHPEVRARLTRLTMGNSAFWAFEAEVVPDERANVARGADYTIKPVNSSEKYRWQVAADLVPLTFQDLPAQETPVVAPVKTPAVSPKPSPPRQTKELEQVGVDDRKLILAEFKRRGGAITEFGEKWLDDEIASVIRRQFNNDRAAFERDLAQKGQTLEQFRTLRGEAAIILIEKAKVTKGITDPAAKKRAIDEWLRELRAKSVSSEPNAAKPAVD
jgi:transglutaminase-like putative cysteine protease